MYLLKVVGSVSSREIFKTLKSKVARSFFVSGPILNGSCKAALRRCDPNRGQRRERDAAVPPRCDPNRGQRGGQSGSPSSSNGSCVAGAGRGAGLRPSGCSSMMMPTILSSTCSSPGLGNIGRGAATRCSAGDLASSRVAGSKIRSAWRSGAHGAVGSSGGVLCWSSGCSSTGSSGCSSRPGWRVLTCVEKAGL